MEKLLLIDGHSIMSRAFYGIPRLSTGDGRPTNAVYGFFNIVLKAVEDEEASHIAVAFDLDRRKLKRTAMYPEYKGTRKPMPQELHEQIPMVQEILLAMNVPIITMEGYEADDILGTLAKRAAEDGLSVTVLSGDRDLLQLADENIKISIPRTTKGSTEVFSYYPDDVKSEYGVTPLQFIDEKALMGDASDNIPGLPGVGEKTAADIIMRYGSIENALAHVDEIRPPRAQAAFREHFDLAVLSKKLATIDTDSPVEADYRSGITRGMYTGKALSLIRELELKSLAARFLKKMNEEPQDASFASDSVSLPEIEEITDREEGVKTLFSSLSKEYIGLSLYVSSSPAEPEQLSLFETVKEGPSFAALSVCFDEKKVCVLTYDAALLIKDAEEFCRMASLENTVISMIGLKSVLKHLPQLQNTKTFDSAVASYLLNPLRGDYDYETISKDCLSLVLKSRKELSVKPGEFSPDILSWEAFCARAAYPVLTGRLKASGMDKLYDEIEYPLIFVLNDMENAGIKVDKKALSGYASYLKGLIDELEQKIYEGAGEIFNINSPKQLGTILFEKLGIKGGKKTKTGYSTAADVLEKAAPDYPIVRDILSYRTYTKLYSTYAEGLREYIEEDGRIHGTFNQTVTATGRLSSTDPNLQNIPVRTEEGREIRKVFIPDDGCIFIDADYSQVELRILASLSGDEKLINAYRDSVDIHTLTASEVFHVPVDAVTKQMRSNAKAVNFGIVYGISAFGLGEGLSISRREANEYIEKYFETYPQVKSFLDGTVAEAKEKGYTTTYFGRRRPVPELMSSNYMERSFGERVAMNSPIQGTAADIMKIAMVRVAQDLKNLRSRIVLQIHDELLIEAYPEEAEQVKEILKRGMEGAAALPVKLISDVKEGCNWNECH